MIYYFSLQLRKNIVQGRNGVSYCIFLPQKWSITIKVRTSKECMFQLGYLTMHLMRLFKQPQKLQYKNVFRPINILQKHWR